MACSLKYYYHRIKPLTCDELVTEWSTVQYPGFGLINRSQDGSSLNICYVNAVIQCLAYAPMFTEWCLNTVVHGLCK